MARVSRAAIPIDQAVTASTSVNLGSSTAGRGMQQMGQAMSQAGEQIEQENKIKKAMDAKMRTEIDSESRMAASEMRSISDERMKAFMANTPQSEHWTEAFEMEKQALSRRISKLDMSEGERDSQLVRTKNWAEERDIRIQAAALSQKSTDNIDRSGGLLLKAIEEGSAEDIQEARTEHESRLRERFDETEVQAKIKATFETGVIKRDKNMLAIEQALFDDIANTGNPMAYMVHLEKEKALGVKGRDTDELLKPLKSDAGRAAVESSIRRAINNKDYEDASRRLSEQNVLPQAKKTSLTTEIRTAKSQDGQKAQFEFDVTTGQVTMEWQELFNNNLLTPSMINNAQINVPLEKASDLTSFRTQWETRVNAQAKIRTDANYDPAAFALLQREGLLIQDNRQFMGFLDKVGMAEADGKILDTEAKTIRDMSPEKLTANIKASVDASNRNIRSTITAKTAEFNRWFATQATIAAASGKPIDAIKAFGDFERLRSIREWAAGRATTDFTNWIIDHPDASARERNEMALRIDVTWNSKTDIVLEEENRAYLEDNLARINAGKK